MSKDPKRGLWPALLSWRLLKMALEVKKIKFIIFDLDDTLFDTYGQLVGPAAEESCKAMIDAGLKTSIKECLMKREELQKNHPREDIYELLARHFDIKPPSNIEKVIEAGFNAF